MNNMYFIAGHHGVGKTFLVNELKKEIDLTHFDTGPMIRALYAKSNTDVSFKSWILAGEEKYGLDFTNQIICQEMKHNLKNDTPNIVITGNRSLEGIMYISKYFFITLPSIIYLESPFDLLKTNYEARERIKLTDLEFEKKFLEEIKSGLYNIRDYVIEHQDTCLFVHKLNNDDKTVDIVKRKILVKGEQ